MESKKQLEPGQHRVKGKTTNPEFHTQGRQLSFSAFQKWRIQHHHICTAHLLEEEALPKRRHQMEMWVFGGKKNESCSGKYHPHRWDSHSFSMELTCTAECKAKWCGITGGCWEHSKHLPVLHVLYLIEEINTTSYGSKAEFEVLLPLSVTHVQH